MTELLEHFKLSNIPDAEIGERIKATIYFFVHLYAFAYVLGITSKKIINTPLKELNLLCHELTHVLNGWIEPLYLEPQPTMLLSSNLQPKEKVWMSQHSSDNCLSKPRQSTLQVLPQTRLTGERTKPLGFK